MNNSIWRLAALSGVVGLGLLVVFQAQKGLDLKTLGKTFGVKQTDADGNNPDDTPQAEGDQFLEPNEPLLGPESISRSAFVEGDDGQSQVTTSSRTNSAGLRVPSQFEPPVDDQSDANDPFRADNEGSVQRASNAAVSRRPVHSGGVDFRKIEEENLDLDESPESQRPARRPVPRVTADTSDSIDATDNVPMLAAPGAQDAEPIETESAPPGIRRPAGRNVVGLFDDEPEQPASRQAPARDSARTAARLDETEPAPRNPGFRAPSRQQVSDDEPQTASSPTRWTTPATSSNPAARTLAAPGSAFDPDDSLTTIQPAQSRTRLVQAEEPSPELAPAERPPVVRQAAPVTKPVESDDDAAFPDPTRETPAPVQATSEPRNFPVTTEPPSTSTRDADERIDRRPAASKQADPFSHVERDGITNGQAPRGQQRPHLSIDKVAPQSAALGQPMVYTIRVRNDGTIPAHQVVVEDRVPRGVQLDGTNPRAEMSEKTKTLLWKLGTLEPGQERTISVRVIPTSEGPIGSVATVNFSTEVSSHTVVSAPSLRLEVIAAERGTLGQPVAFTFRVTNIGRSEATGVVIRNVLPAALRHSDGDDLEYAVGTLPAGKTKEVTLSVIAAQAGRVVNQAVVTASGGISVQAEASVLVQGASLDVSRTGPKRLFPKKNGRFINTVANPTSQPMLNVSVTETIPAGVEYVASSPEGEYNPARRSVTWTVARLEPRQSRPFEITLASNEVGSKVSVVRASDSTGASGEKVTTTTVIGAPSLAIEVLDGTSPLEVGEQVTYRIRITNRGTDAATNVRPVAIVPATMQVMQIGGQLRFRQVANRIEFEPIPRLEPNGSALATVTLRAIRPGDTRLQTQVQCDQLSLPLTHEEAAIIYSP
jgi:uncharacterized repeat protein (TIGR01451 family)